VTDAAFAPTDAAPTDADAAPAPPEGWEDWESWVFSFVETHRLTRKDTPERFEAVLMDALAAERLTSPENIEVIKEWATIAPLMLGAHMDYGDDPNPDDDPVDDDGRFDLPREYSGARDYVSTRGLFVGWRG
jgi:hypothetical protein